ncbi:lysine N(6)-hydroxylase/L-ornithine N(5)-oxygenase family protein [Amycolatopsis sp. CA-230715]|uniref:lysine N(6)-hydroxylase/L-ornithine N(5)-oxygenase family protein n=1 Tax=Amycolatopsis sp. CA-230715 TaxID=2745196 RepID=UPI001C029A8E|nr:SidA/IucD/PvdA family monooxygenase [Amycolatopsis sp. CA-230715]QWF76834.1 L-lysine N6-monooxygenase [Amycolatopsis sp. CA-230715]
MTPLDLAGIGIGPFNLSLAALAHPVTGLRAAFFDRRPEFRWHPGLLLPGTTLQVPFLADLVSLADPTNPLSFLNYLREHRRLFPFYFAERFHIPRAEYDHYARWASERLPACEFGAEVRSVGWSGDAFELRFADRDPVLARSVVLGVGTVPHLPEPLRELASGRDAPVVHSAGYLGARARLLASRRVLVVGSGQSGAEVFLDQLQHRSTVDGLGWLARTRAFAPMEYSKLGLEQFTPDYTTYFHGLGQRTRERLLPAQWQLYKGVDAETLSRIHGALYERGIGGTWPKVTLMPGVEVFSARRTADGVELGVRHVQQGTETVLEADAVVAATGYRDTPLDELLAPLGVDFTVPLEVDRGYRLRLPEKIPGTVYVQNAERHTHGVGTPDLGLGAWRAASIVNAVTGRTVYPLPDRTAFTTFGLPLEEQ